MGRAVLLCALGAEPVKGGRGRDGRARTGLNAQCPTAIAAGHCGVRGLCFFLFPFFFFPLRLAYCPSALRLSRARRI